MTDALTLWAMRHHVSLQALAELPDVLAAVDIPTPALAADQSEAGVQSRVRLEAAQAGVWMTRNNVGAYQDPRSPRWIRYGLANESKAQNSLVKSADLIGMRRRVIITSDVGTVIGQFVSRECKRQGWKFNPNDAHERAQAAWRDFVNSNGGDAAIVSGPGSFNYTTR